MTRRAPWLHSQAWFGLCALLLGCTALVEKHPARPRCEAGAADPCPRGLTCVAGYCVTPEVCEPEPEVCGDGIDNDCDGDVDEPDTSQDELCGDGIDNDCDGEIDEGHDKDGDGVQWCGDIRNGGPADCDDLNPAVYPGAIEVCDNYDNDCNRAVDDAPASRALCPSGEECVGRCIKPSCAIPGSSAACDDDERCDADTGTCVRRDCGAISCPNGQYCDEQTTTCRAFSRGRGEACADDADCVSGVCIEAAAVGLSAEAVRVCGEACCHDGDCSENETCFAPGNGARSCLPSAIVAKLSPVAPTCSSTTECDGGYCSPVLLRGTGGKVGNASAGFVSAGCVVPPTNKLKLAEFCNANSECATGICLRNTLLGAAGVCSEACGTSSDCTSFGTQVFAGLVGLVGDAYCRTLLTQVDATHSGYVPTCVLDTRKASGGKAGATCTSGSQCEDGVCAATRTGSRCAPACCNDADCRSNGQTGTCRPLTFGDHYEMRCVL